MQFFKVFYRAQEDGFILPMFGSVHVVMLVIWILGILMIYRYREELKNTKIEYIIAGLMILDQIHLYAWQFLSGYFNLKESLPLFQCRLAIWFMIIALLKNSKIFKVPAIYWGLQGSVLSMLFVDLYPFNFPHITNIQYFALHILLGWAVFYIIFVKEYRFNKHDLSRMLIFTNVFNVILLAVNIFLNNLGHNANYGYIYFSPEFLDSIAGWLPNLAYVVAAFIITNVVVILVHLFGKLMNRIENIN